MLQVWCSFLNKFGLNTQTTTLQWGLGVGAGYSAREEGEFWNYISFERCQFWNAWLICRNFVSKLCTWEILCLFLVPFICISKSLLTTAYDSLWCFRRRVSHKWLSGVLAGRPYISVQTSQTLTMIPRTFDSPTREQDFFPGSRQQGKLNQHKTSKTTLICAGGVRWQRSVCQLWNDLRRGVWQHHPSFIRLVLIK